MTEAEIKRINELYHKSKGVYGLTDEEKEEQQRLRRKYIDDIKGNIKSQLENINIQEKDGSITRVKDIPGKKAKPEGIDR